MSLRDAVMQEFKTEQVEAFGGVVTVSEIGALGRIAYIEYLQKMQADEVGNERAGMLLQVFLMVKCAIEDGKRVFEDDEVEKIADSNINLLDLSKVFTAAAKLNKLTAESQEGN